MPSLRSSLNPLPTPFDANVPVGGKKSFGEKLSPSARLNVHRAAGEVCGSHVFPLSNENSVKTSKKLLICVRAVDWRVLVVLPVEARVGLSLRRNPPPRSRSSASISVSCPGEPSLEGTSRSVPVHAPAHPEKLAPPSSEISPEQRPCEETDTGALPEDSTGMPEENWTARLRRIGPGPVASPGN